MSSIISSFFIEPVVRQARRFSNIPDPSSSHDEIAQRQGTGPSHAISNTADTAMSEMRCQSASISTVSNEGNPPVSLGQALFDRFAPLLTTSRSVSSSPDSTTTCARQSSTYPLDAAVLPPVVAIIPGSQRQTRSSSITSPRTTQNQVPDTSDREQVESNTEPDASSPSSMPLYSPSRTSPMRLPSRERTIQALRLLSAQSGGSLTHSPRGSRALDTRVLNSKPSESLPENDGNELLRQKIFGIWESDLPTEEKAQKMHAIMNESYHASQSYGRPKSPDSIISQGRPLSSDSSTSLVYTLGSSLDAYSNTPMAVDPANPYNVQPEDLLPSYQPPITPEALEDSTKLVSLEESSSQELELGCMHYKRNVKIQCFACKTWWPCRNCHDEAELGHELPRHLTENMLCMTCKTPGPAGQYCKHCSTIAAHYFCDICKLWDDSNRSIYHCAGCGICRLGEGIGKDYEHCKVCYVASLTCYLILLKWYRNVMFVLRFNIIPPTNA
jgi:CHY zinc finger